MGSWWSGLIPDAEDIIGGVGSALGGASQAQASNRGSKLAAQMALAQMMMLRDSTYWDQLMDKEKFGFSSQLQREQEGRAGREDAWRKLQSAQRVLSPEARPMLSPYSRPARQATAPERQGAEALSAEVMARLQGGNPIALPNLPTPEKTPVNIDEGLMDAGLSEQTMGWLAPILTAAGSRRRQQSQYPPGTIIYT